MGEQDMGDLFRQRRKMANNDGSNNTTNNYGRSGGRSNHHRQNKNQRQVASYPIEQGCLCSLKENFGFIRCANRDEEVFFHYSELLSSSPADLQMDQEVEFRLGPDSRTGERHAAYQVKLLEPGTVVWETEEYDGKPQRGIVERKPGRSGVDGAIRLGEEADGPRVKFTGDMRLGKGDLVECVVMKQKSNGLLYAKDTKLILSERERTRLEKEKRLLENATVEEGVVVALKGEYGFLRSSSRRDEVYFHYSSVDIGDNEEKDPDDELVIREGQDMKFLVVNEDDDASPGRPSQPRRISARRVQLKPRGSVIFDEVIARGVTGVVTEVPHCVDKSHNLEQHGKVLLDSPVSAKNFELGEQVEGTRTITEVFLSPQDSPGGRFSFHGGESVGLYVERGDKLLFDVSIDYCDGACRATPTRYLTPPKAGEKAAKAKGDTPSAVRLVSLSLAGRSEGTVNALKEGYGFIQFAERSVDVHFRMFQMLPDNLQDDLRRNMGLANTDDLGQPLRLELGANVQFDISIRGKISGHNRNARGKVKGNERENLKAQRILLLPPNTVTRFIDVVKTVRARVTKQEMMQPYVGNVELENEIDLSTALEHRHPLVAKLIRSYLSDVETKGESNVPPILFHDSLSAKEDEVAMKLMEVLGNGRLAANYVTESGVMGQRLCISVKGDEADSGNNDEEDKPSENDTPEQNGNGKDEKKSQTNKNVKAKPIKSIRFDKQSFTEEQLNGKPFSIDDVVLCDVQLCRRSGHCHVGNVQAVEEFAPQLSSTGLSEVGYVKDISATKVYGFIAITGEKKEKEPLLFRTSNVVGDSSIVSSIKRGDCVKFDIATDQLGKKVATNIEVIPGESAIMKPDKGACNGIVLLQPNHITAKNTPKRKFTSSKAAEATNTRWAKVDLEDDDAETIPLHELGCILITEDPKNSDEGGSMIIARYRSTDVAHRGGVNGMIGDIPRRGDLVSFHRKQDNSIKDVRILQKGVPETVRGVVSLSEDTDGDIKGSIKTEQQEVAYTFQGSDVVGCDAKQLKSGDKVEGILHDGKLVGIARVADLYLDTKLGSGLKERPKLNLTVKKDRGGTIMAQSMMAKGPDGTNGFVPGWTSRTSIILKEVPSDLSVVAKEFVPLDGSSGIQPF